MDAPGALLLQRPHLLVAEELQELVEGRGEVAGIKRDGNAVLICKSGLVRHILRPQKITAPDLRRAETQAPRRDVEDAVHHDRRSGAPGCAVSSAEQLVADDIAADISIMLDPVRGAQMVDRVEGYPVLLHRVSAEVRPEAVIDRDNPAVVFEPDADLMHLFTVMAGRHEMLVAALDSLDRSAYVQSKDGSDDLFRVHLHLRANPAADLKHDDAQPPHFASDILDDRH